MQGTGSVKAYNKLLSKSQRFKKIKWSNGKMQNISFSNEHGHQNELVLFVDKAF